MQKFKYKIILTILLVCPFQSTFAINGAQSVQLGLSAYKTIASLITDGVDLQDLKKAKQAKVSKGEISETLAKVMAVAAGKKRLQFQDVINKYDIDL